MDTSPVGIFEIARSLLLQEARKEELMFETTVELVSQSTNAVHCGRQKDHHRRENELPLGVGMEVFAHVTV